MAEQRRRPKRGLEAEVLACLAAADGPLTVGEVQAQLGGDLAYTTVLTALIRLHQKGALQRSARGRAHAYDLVGGQEGAMASLTAHQMKRLLEAGADRAGVLTRFVAGLDEEDEAVLRELLAASAEPPSVDDDQEQG